MQLRAYLKLVDRTYSALAQEMGFSQAATVQRHAEGVRRPDALTIEKYRKLTNGAVTAQDWHDLALQVADKSNDSQDKPTNGRPASTNGGGSLEPDSATVKAA
jgi:hypothetical protein